MRREKKNKIKPGKEKLNSVAHSIISALEGDDWNIVTFHDPEEQND